MKHPFPDWHMAKLALEGYAQDGVSGQIGYDSETATWYAELDDAEYEQYLANLGKRDSIVLEDFGSLDWQGAVNIQGTAVQPPGENENRLSLYLLDCDCKTTRGFKVNASMAEFMQRKVQHLFIGSTCMSCGKKMLALLIWEDVKP